jgi:hypothetical protein
MALVEEHWGEICAVAAELIKRKRIDAIEADLIIRSASGDAEAAGELDRYRAFHDSAADRRG